MVRYRVRRPNTEYWFKNIPCQSACPVGTRAGEYVTAIANGDYNEAAQIVVSPNPLSLICGLVCAHPCENVCRRGNIDKPVSIRALKRFALEQGQLKSAGAIHGSPLQQKGKKVAIIGAGPSGLVAAMELANLGYQPTIFEATNTPGGMTAYGIPRYRLPLDVVKENTRFILDNLKIDVRTNVIVGQDILVGDLLTSEGFSAVIAAVGCQLPRKIPLEGRDLSGVFEGIDFLRESAMGKYPDLGKKVVVVGGGNVAMDIARSAVRIGSGEVHLTCLEARDEMPASLLEIEEAEEEGVIIHNRIGPKRVLGNEKVTGFEVIKVKRVFDEQKRFAPVFEEGSEHPLSCDAIILAIGQMSDAGWAKGLSELAFTRFGTPVVDKETLSTTVKGLFVAGDLATGPGIAIQAVESGIKAARQVDAYLKGQKVSLKRRVSQRLVKKTTSPEIDYIRRHDIPTLSPAERKKGFDQVELGFDTDTAIEEAKRCLNCFINTVFNEEKCLLCGGCVDICPNSCLRLIRQDEAEIKGEEISTPAERTLLIKDEERCIRCGLCVGRCPAGAINMISFEFEKEWVYE